MLKLEITIKKKLTSRTSHQNNVKTELYHQEITRMIKVYTQANYFDHNNH